MSRQSHELTKAREREHRFQLFTIGFVFACGLLIAGVAFQSCESHSQMPPPVTTYNTGPVAPIVREP